MSYNNRVYDYRSCENCSKRCKNYTPVKEGEVISSPKSFKLVGYPTPQQISTLTIIPFTPGGRIIINVVGGSSPELDPHGYGLGQERRDQTVRDASVVAGPLRLKGF